MPIGIVILVFDLILWIILILKSSVKKRARIGTLLLATILLCVITFIVFFIFSNLLVNLHPFKYRSII